MTSEMHINDTSANPAPLGLLAFGMTTVLLNLHNVGLFPNNAMILGMGLFVGGLAQVFAGLLESKKGNTFGTTAFTAFGTFWLSLVAVWVLPEMGLAAKPDATAMAAYLAIWGLLRCLDVDALARARAGLAQMEVPCKSSSGRWPRSSGCSRWVTSPTTRP